MSSSAEPTTVHGVSQYVIGGSETDDMKHRLSLPLGKHQKVPQRYQSSVRILPYDLIRKATGGAQDPYRIIFEALHC